MRWVEFVIWNLFIIVVIFAIMNESTRIKMFKIVVLPAVYFKVQEYSIFKPAHIQSFFASFNVIKVKCRRIDRIASELKTNQIQLDSLSFWTLAKRTKNEYSSLGKLYANKTN